MKKKNTKTTGFEIDLGVIQITKTLGGLKKIQKTLKGRLKEPLKLIKLVDSKILKMQNKKTKKTTQSVSATA